jgi:hypothetical protein
MTKTITVVHKGGISGGYPCDIVNGEGGNGGSGTAKVKTLSIKELSNNYIKLVEFVKEISDHLDECVSPGIQREASRLLKSIGELE